MVVLQPIKPGSVGCPPTSRLNLSLKRGRARRALALLGNNNTQQNLQLAESLLTISAEEFTHKWNFDPIQGVPLPSGRFQWTPLNPVTSSPSASDLSKAVTSSTDVPMAVMVTSPDLCTSAGDGANPVQDKGQEQKTCVTLPTTCEVTAGQPRPDLDQNQTSTSENEDCEEKNTTDTHSCCPRTCLACCTDNNTAAENNSKEMMLVQQTASSSTQRVLSNSICSETVAVATDSGIDSDESVIEETDMSGIGQTPKTKLKQTCITDFVKPKKLSTFKVPEALQHSSSSSSPSPSSSSTSTSSSNSASFSKKRSASSLQDHQLGQPPHKKVLLHLRA